MEPNQAPKAKGKPFIIISVVAALLAVYGVFKGYHAFTHESTDNAQIESNAIPIVSRLAGYIDSIAIKDFQNVKPSEVLVQIDPREYELALSLAEADLLSAEADLSNANAQLLSTEVNKRVSQSNLDIQEVRLNKAKTDLLRDESLFKDNSITRKQLDDTRSAYETAQKQVRSNQDQLSYAQSQTGTIKAQIDKVKAQIAAKKSALENAKLRLSYTKITSPIAGKVGRTNLQPGQYVQPGQTLFTLVNNEQFWVTANFKETQLEKLKEGMEADIIIDGYPNVSVKAKIEGLSDATGARFALLPPDNATGNFVKVTQRVPVKLSIQNLAEVKPFLKTGMSVTVSVKTN
ncbi:MAG: multidrug transporter [Bacteroidetes bacterium B1(2017)]|nr:MAG: multidrug transporter [Bacteroidetes bacterium B1(2017)]